MSKLARDCRLAIAQACTPPISNVRLDAFEFSLPLRTQSEANMREPWRAKAGRHKKQRTAVAWVMRGLRAQVAVAKTWPAWTVKLTRVARAELDPDDNLNGSFKAIRDQLTQELGLGKWSVPKKAGVKPRFLPDDRSKRIKFEYDQDAAYSNSYSVRVRIERREMP